MLVVIQSRWLTEYPIAGVRGKKWVGAQSPKVGQSHRRKPQCLGDTSVRSVVGISQMRGSRALSASRPHVRGDGVVAKLDRESGVGYLVCGRVRVRVRWGTYHGWYGLKQRLGRYSWYTGYRRLVKQTCMTASRGGSRDRRHLKCSRLRHEFARSYFYLVSTVDTP